RPVGLGGEPLDGGGLLIRQARPSVTLAEDPAVVLAGDGLRPAVGEIPAPRLAGEVLGAAGVLHVLVEGPAPGEPLGGDEALGHAVLLASQKLAHARNEA